MSVIVNSPPDRRRLSSDESRHAALEAARALLIEEGPKAITLKAVAARIGRTHANLLHHFGSAEGLQRALVANITETVSQGIASAVADARRGERDPRDIVELVFDSFGRQGGGILTAWMVLNGNQSTLEPLLAIMRNLVDELVKEGNPDLVRDEALRLMVMALGNALMGPALAKTLGLPTSRAADLATQGIVSAWAQVWEEPRAMPDPSA